MRILVKEMKRAFVWVVAVACFSFGIADDVKSAKRVIQANYKTIGKAFANHDAKSIEDLQADDYTATENGKLLTKAQMSAQLVKEMKEFSSSSWNRTITSFKLAGKRATVDTNSVFEGTLVAGPDGVAHKVKQLESNTDIWVKSGKNYKLQKSVNHKTTTFFDGQPFHRRGS